MSNIHYTINAVEAPGERVILKPFVPIRVVMPYSEVCMHLGIAGQERDIVLTVVHQDGYERAAVRILKEGWETINDEWTIPITTGEAGVLTDRVRHTSPECNQYSFHTDRAGMK